MKYTITIEEVVSQDFEVEATNKEEAIKLVNKKYRDGDLVLEPGNLLSVEFSIY